MLLFKDFLKACIANSVKAQPNKRFPHQFQQWKTICILAKPRTIEFSVQKVSIPPTIPVSHPNTDVCFSLQGNERTEAVCFSCVKHKPKSAAHLRVLKAFSPQIFCVPSLHTTANYRAIKIQFSIMCATNLSFSVSQIRLKMSSVHINLRIV